MICERILYRDINQITHKVLFYDHPNCMFLPFTHQIDSNSARTRKRYRSIPYLSENSPVCPVYHTRYHDRGPPKHERPIKIDCHDLSDSVLFHMSQSKFRRSFKSLKVRASAIGSIVRFESYVLG